MPPSGGSRTNRSRFDTAMVLGPERDGGRGPPDPAGGAQGSGIVGAGPDGRVARLRAQLRRSAGCCRMPGSATSCTNASPPSMPTMSTDPRAAFDLIVTAELEFAPVLHHGGIVGTVSREEGAAFYAVPADAGCAGPPLRRRGDRDQRRCRGQGEGARRGRRRRARARHRARAPGDVRALDFVRGTQAVGSDCRRQRRHGRR